MEFSIFVNVAIAVGFFAFAALCIYLIVIARKLRDAIVQLQEDVSEINRNAVPLFENLKVITDKFRNISENVNDQIDILRSSVESVSEMTENIVSFEKKIQSEVEGPVMEAFSFVSALVKAVKAFAAKMKE